MNNKHFTIVSFYQFKKDFDQSEVLLELKDLVNLTKLKAQYSQMKV